MDQLTLDNTNHIIRPNWSTLIPTVIQSGLAPAWRHSPFMLWLVDDQQNLELLGDGGRRGVLRRLHKPRRGRCRLFDHVTDLAEGTEEAGGSGGGGSANDGSSSPGFVVAK